MCLHSDRPSSTDKHSFNLDSVPNCLYHCANLAEKIYEYKPNENVSLPTGRCVRGVLCVYHAYSQIWAQL